MTDAPEEIERVPENRELGSTLGRVFGGAYLVGFHHDKGLLAVWYGGTGFNVYDPAQWFGQANGPRNQPNGETGEVYHFNVMGCADDGETEFVERLNAAKVHLAGYGFHVADPAGNALEV